MKNTENIKVINLYKAGKSGFFQVISAPKAGLLENLGLRTGTKVEIKNRYALGGPVLLKVEDAYSLAIGKDIAEFIQVINLSEENAS
jgi:Fe2+ transport system protein FeoA